MAQHHTQHAAEPMCSVIVPAHDEGPVIAENLRSLLDGFRPGEVDVVVVANGCTDDTADEARSVRGVHVIETPVASKSHALNTGDRAARTLPRIYLDADVRLPGESLRHLARELTTDRPVIGAPRVSFELSASSWPVRAFYSVLDQLPYTRDELGGRGVYGLSASGRARFDTFPDVIADDLFVQSLFGPEERRLTKGASVVRAPLDTASLLAIRTRVVRGNRQLAERRTAQDGGSELTARATARGLVQLVGRRPRFLPAAAVYVAVVLLARLRADRTSATASWERDDTSRAALGSRGASAPHPGRLRVDGVQFDALTEEQVVEHVLSELAAGRGGCIVTPNVDIHRQLRHGPEAGLAERAQLVVPDGMPIVWASRLAGTPLPERVAGASLIWSLSRAAASAGHGIFLLGTTEPLLAAAGGRLSAEIPGLRISGCLSPPFVPRLLPPDVERIAAELQAVSPAIVFVGMGFPKQERLMADLREHLPGTWFLGCGASIDFVAGVTRRAPRAIQRLGLEWVFRLAQEPRRLARRYLLQGIPHALGMLARSAAGRLR